MPRRRGSVSAGAAQCHDDVRVIRGERGRQRRRPARVRCIGIRAAREERIHRLRLTTDDRQHQRRAAGGVARIDVDLLVEQRLQPRRIAALRRLPQRRGGMGVRRLAEALEVV